MRNWHNFAIFHWQLENEPHLWFESSSKSYNWWSSINDVRHLSRLDCWYSLFHTNEDKCCKMGNLSQFWLFLKRNPASNFEAAGAVAKIGWSLKSNLDNLAWPNWWNTLYIFSFLWLSLFKDFLLLSMDFLYETNQWSVNTRTDYIKSWAVSSR